MRDSIQHYPCAFPSHSHLLQDFEFTHRRIEFEVWIFRQLCSLRGSPPLVASLQWLEFNPAGPANYPGRLVGASASFSASLLHILPLSCSRFPLRTLCAFSKRFPLVFAPTRFCLTGAAPLCVSWDRHPSARPTAPRPLQNTYIFPSKNKISLTFPSPFILGLRRVPNNYPWFPQT